VELVTFLSGLKAYMVLGLYLGNIPNLLDHWIRSWWIRIEGFQFYGGKFPFLILLCNIPGKTLIGVSPFLATSIYSTVGTKPRLLIII